MSYLEVIRNNGRFSRDPIYRGCYRTYLLARHVSTCRADQVSAAITLYNKYPVTGRLQHTLCKVCPPFELGICNGGVGLASGLVGHCRPREKGSPKAMFEINFQIQNGTSRYFN